MKVIVADDSMLTRKIVVKFIKPLGYDPLQAANGQEVIDLLDQQEEMPAIILMDWNMPIMDGLQALKIIQKNPKYSAVPVIMLTSESDAANIDMAFEAGAKGYITKPFTSDDLVTTIRDTLK